MLIGLTLGAHGARLSVTPSFEDGLLLFRARALDNGSDLAGLLVRQVALPGFRLLQLLEDHFLDLVIGHFKELHSEGNQGTLDLFAIVSHVSKHFVLHLPRYNPSLSVLFDKAWVLVD